MAKVVRDCAHALHQHGQHDPKQARSPGAEICDIVAMVLKILADFGRVVDEVDSEALQVLGGTNS